MKIILLNQFKLANGKIQPQIHLTYEIFGQPLGKALIVLVNHALTGNSNITGEKGWWQSYVGKNKAINTDFCTVLAFNVPGNGYQNGPLIENYTDFSAKDIANIFWKGIEFLKINQLFAIIGGSLGGGIAWEMAFLQPTKFKNLVVIAAHWKASNWVLANTKLQAQLLENSSNPLQDARTHAMLLYRTPQSLEEKFSNPKNNTSFNVENWLDYHADQLTNRFTLAAYKLMNHLLKSVGSTANLEVLLAQTKQFKNKIHLVSINTDQLFIASEIYQTHQTLQANHVDCSYFEIESIHGHDAFLMPNAAFESHLKSIFNNTLISVYEHE
uniref:alpha/beta fold hydrolase n=1 Tax=Flavobacterium sp. TaxID=239 RepID=UPI0040496AC9